MDMDSLRRDNEKSVALGNMKVNARGDQINRGQITKTAEQIARENHRVQSAVMSTSLKGPAPALEDKPQRAKPAPAKTGKTQEKELPSGDIVIEGKDD